MRCYCCCYCCCCSKSVSVFKVFKKLFNDGLSIQKERIRDLRNYAKEQRQERAKRQQLELEALEN